MIEETGADYKVLALCANNNIKLLELQARKFKPEFCVVYSEHHARELKTKLNDTSIKVLSGIEGINFIASHERADYVINALMGQIGIMPTLAAVEAGRNIGLANKEPLVCAGELIMRRSRETGARILPVDSEHCAVFQCILGEEPNDIEKLILTASGGPFYGKSRTDLENVSLAQTLKHPTWNMGKKITVDSATMMNKGLELIEARWLFDIMPENIEILIHRESIVHSLVQFIDKSVIAQLSLPDMKFCIHYALSFHSKNKREKRRAEELDLAQIKNLSFAPPDNQTFIFPELARFAVNEGGTLPAVMNAANEAAVDLFLAEKIKFSDIFELVERSAACHKNIKNPNIDDIIDCVNETSNRIRSEY
ncbi:MAG: 1-deoxy-D-xylulose-5-phosphate reductoisomerase [Oscillospiraceae bacterium]|nr:1-deoxy-D-xylulose-5-phosphate reductoisomerase [Oscillospiraceae bacterium]